MLCRKIVDSIMALFRVDFSGRGELSERQQKVIYSMFSLTITYLLALSQLAQVRSSVIFALFDYHQSRGRCSPSCPNFLRNSMQVLRSDGRTTSAHYRLPKGCYSDY